MRILHVIHSIDLRHGGPSHALRAIIQGQIAAGHEVSLLSTVVQAAEPWQAPEAYRRAVGQEQAFEKCDVNLVAAWGRRRPWSTFAFSPAGRAWLRRRLADPLRSPEIVHVHGVFSDVTSVAAAQSFRRRIPCVIRLAGILDSHCLGSGRKWVKRAYLRISLHRQLRRAAFLHATSRSEADELARWAPAARIRTVPLGVAVKGRAEACAIERFLRRFPQLRGKRIVLFLGRIAPKKRAELLVAALAQLRQEAPDVALLLVGQDDGGMAAVDAAVRQYNLQEAVVHAGFLQGEEKDAAFAAPSLFALASFDENFGVAVVEAMAHGLPVLVTRGVAAREYVFASGGGLVVEATPAALADGIRQLFAGDAQQMGQAGRQYVEKNLSWPAALARIEEMYWEAIALGMRD